MFFELFAVLSVAVALGVFQYKVEVKRAERMLELLHKEMELEKQQEEENSNN